MPDGVRRLHALLDFEIETGIVKRLADRFYEFVNALFLVGHVAVYLGADVVIGIRLLVTQPDVLHLGLDLIETEPVRQRNENEHGLAQNLVALVFRHEFDGAAIVQTVSEFDQYHADIIIESQENTFEILRLEALRVAGIIVLLVLIVEHVLDFRQTVD